jgi:hypothetical protein
MPKNLYTLISLVALFACSQQPRQPEKSQSPAVNPKGLDFLVAIQTRNFAKSADYCAQQSPSFKQAFATYINNYRLGTSAALQKIGPQEGLNLEPEEKDMSTFLALQDIQGDDMLASIKPNPAQGCAKIMGIFSAMSVHAAEQQMYSHFAEYTAKRKAYCSKQPKPANCL